MTEMGFLGREHPRSLRQDTQNHVLASPAIYVGSVNAGLISAAEILQEAAKADCTETIVAHNYPSGDPTSWPEAIAVTEQIVATAKLRVIDL